MEKHKCKLCLRSFSNGRALGGHMRSHMMNLPIPPKEPQDINNKTKLAEQEATESASSQSLPPPQQQRRRGAEEEEEEEEEEEDDMDIDKSLYYGLRENPKRSIKLVDPEFSMILQDRESETESSKNPTRRRSMRARKPDPLFTYHLDLHHNHSQYHDVTKGKGAESSWAEPEPVSSISDATTEEDVAFCLMMMSRDNWRKKKSRREYDYVEEEEEEENGDEDDFEGEDDEDEDEEESEFEEDKRQSPRHQQQQQETLKCPKSNRNSCNKYKCETCDKVFRSYQALGGHRASHKKVKLTHVVSSELNDAEFKARKSSNDSNAVVVVGTPAAEKKVHKCPVCFRVFASGQALGGHKRSHVIVSHHETTPKQAAKTTTATIVSPVVVVVERRLNNKINGESLIDLNLPAPDYDDCYDDNDEISQIELSAVSDAEFVNNTVIRQ